MILRLCDRFHVLPSQLMKEPAELLLMIEVVGLGTPADQRDDPEGEVYDGA